MKNQTIRDERVISQRRKVSSEADGILMFALLASILLQQFIMNAPFKQYAAEFLCFFGVSIYKLVRYLSLGLDLNGSGTHSKRMPLIHSLIAGLTVTTVTGGINYSQYAGKYQVDGIGYFLAMLLVTFLGSTAISYLAAWLFYHQNTVTQKKIQQQLDDEENR